MFKKILFLVLIAYGAYADSFKFTEDKAKHLAVSALISGGIETLWHNDQEDFSDTAAPAIAVAITIGTLKEVYDDRKGGSGFSMYDFGYDVAGSILGATGTFFLNNKLRTKGWLAVIPKEDGANIYYSMMF